MAQNLTYTQCGDYYIPDIRLEHTGHRRLANTAGCAEHSWNRTNRCFSTTWF